MNIFLTNFLFLKKAMNDNGLFYVSN